MASSDMASSSMASSDMLSSSMPSIASSFMSIWSPIDLSIILIMVSRSGASLMYSINGSLHWIL